MHALGRALAAFVQPSSWHVLQRNAMSCDFGWDASTKNYLALYADLVDARPALHDTRVRKSPVRARTAASAGTRREEFNAGVGEMARSA
jgi:starch synthase